MTGASVATPQNADTHTYVTSRFISKEISGVRPTFSARAVLSPSVVWHPCTHEGAVNFAYGILRISFFQPRCLSVPALNRPAVSVATLPAAAEVQAPVPVPSPVARTPSPPVARRTRSKSPASVQKTSIAAAGVALASPRAKSKKRASSSMAASPAAKVKGRGGEG